MSTDADQDAREDAVASIERCVEYHPEATPIEVVANVGLSPAEWVPVAEAIMSGEEPDLPDANPGVNAGETASLPGESGDFADHGETVDESNDETTAGANDQGDRDASGEHDRDGDDVEADAITLGRELDLDATAWGEAAAGTAVDGDTYPDEWGERDRWMTHTHGDKKPFAPWADADHPEADPDDDARWKWGLPENYADLATAREWAEKHPKLGGVTYLLGETEIEPFAFVDGDDVRCPETGEWHPAFVALLEKLGMTYADISTSGSGVHAVYRGDLPDDVAEAKPQLDDEPWGANDDPPVAEIYDHKKVCVATGDHVPGTPTSVHEWDADALDELLDEFGILPDDDPTPSAAFDAFDADEYDPEATEADETAEDIRDVFAALDRLDARRVADRTIAREWFDTSGEARAFRPAWASSDYDGTAVFANAEVFKDTGRRGGKGGPACMAAIDAGLVRDTECPDAVEGETWWKAVEHLRDLGFSVPEVDPSVGGNAGDVEHEAVLPDDDAVETARGTGGWNWRHAARHADRVDDDRLSIDDAREQTREAIADAYETGDRVLVEALPTLGKSYGAIAAADDVDESITFLTGRGRKEQYEQVRRWADERGLDTYTLPSFFEDCDTANGEHGGEWADRVRAWYTRGATPQTIHKHAEDVLGRPLPCQTHEGHDCPYASKWDFDPDEYDVLIGHYTHANKPKVVEGRTVVLDEYPGGAYEQTLAGERLAGAVSRYLDRTDALPFDDHADLVEHRSDEGRRADALAFFLGDDDADLDLDRDELAVLEADDAHALAPVATFTILAGDDLGNGFERTDLGDHGVGLYDREHGRVHVLAPPSLDYTTGVVALDGTPTKTLWELSLDERLNHRQVLADGERREYVRDVLGLSLVRTTDAIKPYNSPDHVAVDQDAALLDAVRDRHGERPAVISTAAAEAAYNDAGVLDDLVDGSKHYGNVLGSNEFKERRLGVVIGSNHYGDGFVKKIGAYAGETVERDEGAKGADLSYTGLGDDVLRHMREHETLQAAMRFGRDGNGAVVYVHTDTLPEWVPVAGEGRVLKTWSDGQRAVLDAVRDLDRRDDPAGDDGWTTRDVVDHPAVSIGERQVRDHLHDLVDRGYLDVETDAPGSGFRWIDGELHRVSDHGDVELDAIALDALDDDESAELSRSSIYTWEFRRSPGERSSLAVETDRSASDPGVEAGRPPDHAGDPG